MSASLCGVQFPTSRKRRVANSTPRPKPRLFLRLKIGGNPRKRLFMHVASSICCKSRSLRCDAVGRGNGLLWHDSEVYAFVQCAEEILQPAHLCATKEVLGAAVRSHYVARKISLSINPAKGIARSCRAQPLASHALLRNPRLLWRVLLAHLRYVDVRLCRQRPEM